MENSLSFKVSSSTAFWDDPIDDFFKRFFFFFFAVLGLRCCTGFSLVAVSGGYSLAVVCRRLIVVASLVAKCRL